MTVINTNINAMLAANASNSASMLQSKSMRALSTGQSINTAADNAAGLAIVNTMTSQINGMTAGVQNANDGISLAETAQGSLTEVTNMLQRIRELAVQSSSGTYQASDRTSMQSEVSNLTQQISSILTNTKFNGNALFAVASGTAAATNNVSFTIQTGANSTDTVTLVSTAFSGGNLFGTSDTTYNTNSAATQVLDVSTVTKAGTTITNIDNAIKEVNATDASFGAGQNRLTSAVNNLNSDITNLSAARSRIQDTNYASTTTQLSKAQILSQASTAMLAQANQSQQNVLSLLK